MGCEIREGPTGPVIACTRGERPMICACGRKGRYLCDGAADTPDGTCNRALCGACTTRVGSLDFGPDHVEGMAPR